MDQQTVADPQPETPNIAKTPHEKVHLTFIDGLRGVAILLVLLAHYYDDMFHQRLPRLIDMFSLGYVGVHLFLLISGFCISWAYIGDKARPFVAKDFAARRAGRILPTYYAALLLGLILFNHPQGHSMLFQVITHLTMTFNFFPSTVTTINGAFWSLALESQLYVLFPLLLLGYRRIGMPRTLAIVLILQTIYRVAVIPYAGTKYTGLTFVLPWGVLGRMFEFALGMFAATLVTAGPNGYRKHINPLTACGLICFAGGAYCKRHFGVAAPVTDLFWTSAFFCTILVGSLRESPINRILTWRPLVGLGLISYSVYLFHGVPLLFMGRLLHLPAGRMHLPAFFAFMILVLGAMILFSYLFYRLVEKPSVDYFARKRRSPTPAAVSAVDAGQIS